MIPDFAAIIIYSVLLTLLLAKKDIKWCPRKCGRHEHSGACEPKKRQVGHDDDEDEDDDGADWETKAPEHSGILGSIHRRIGRKDPRRAKLLHAAEIRTHPNHKAAKAQLRTDMQEEYDRRFSSWRNK